MSFSNSETEKGPKVKEHLTPGKNQLRQIVESRRSEVVLIDRVAELEGNITGSTLVFTPGCGSPRVGVISPDLTNVFVMYELSREQENTAEI